MRTLIQGGDIVGFDGTEHRLIRNGVVVIEDRTIAAVGRSHDGPVDRRIDARGMLVCPGFINTHVHVGIEVMTTLLDIHPSIIQQQTPGADPARTEMISRRWLSPSLAYAQREPAVSLTEEEQRINMEFGVAQLLKTGTTTFLDVVSSGTLWWLGNPPGDVAILADVVGRFGGRAYLSPGMRSYRACMDPGGQRVYHPNEREGLGELERAVRWVEKHHGTWDGRIQGMLYPHAVDNCSPTLLKEARRAATALGIGIQTHCAQTLGEYEVIMKRHGVTPIELLAEIGFLGPDVVLGHTVLTRGHSMLKGGGDGGPELELIADSGASVAHSPRVWAREGIALESFQRYREAGVRMTIGTDMWPVDMIEEMRLVAFLGKVVDRTPRAATAADVFTAATLGGAQAIMRDDLGRIAVGARADLLLVDVGRSYRLGPVPDPVKGLIAAGSGADVHTVIVDGRTVVEGGHLVGVDEERLRRDAERVGAKIRGVLAARDWAGRQEAEMFPPAFREM
jgi:cytosine/adenosine deaminase-related metal-dependent hydrolase